MDRPAGRIPEPTLANPRAERVKRIAALAGRSARSKTGLFLVEGPQGVREALRWAPERVRDVYITPDAWVRYGEIVTAASAEAGAEPEGELGVYLHVATDDVVRAMSPDAQGVLAVVENSGSSLDDLSPHPTLVAVLSNVRDPGNAGAVIRVADAAGADAVVLVGDSVDLTNPKVVRATAGSLFHLPVVRGGSLEDAADTLRAAGLRLVAADGAGTELLGPATEALGEPTAWVFGNEAWGLTADDLALVDAVVRIPVFGKAESLNLATATAVCLYASATAQHAEEP